MTALCPRVPIQQPAHLLQESSDSEPRRRRPCRQPPGPADTYPMPAAAMLHHHLQEQTASHTSQGRPPAWRGSKLRTSTYTRGEERRTCRRWRQPLLPYQGWLRAPPASRQQRHQPEPPRRCSKLLHLSSLLPQPVGWPARTGQRGQTGRRRCRWSAAAAPAVAAAAKPAGVPPPARRRAAAPRQARPAPPLPRGQPGHTRPRGRAPPAPPWQ